MVSAKFDVILQKKQNREITTHIGLYKKEPIMVMSSGMGVDNIDICINELNILANYDIKSGEPLSKRRHLQIIRIGTCGALDAEIPLGAFVASTKAIGIDGILYYYDIEHVIDKEKTQEFIKKMKWSKKLPHPYVVNASQHLLSKLPTDIATAITVTTPSFYGGQGRQASLPLAFPNINKKLTELDLSGQKIGNYEMETSALYGLCSAMQHEALTICLVVAHRVHKTANFDYHKAMDTMINKALQLF
jgi:uridine phosphorylase